GLRSEAHIRNKRNFRLRIRAVDTFLKMVEAYETFLSAWDLISVKVDARDDENLRELFAYVASFQKQMEWVREGMDAGGSEQPKKKRSRSQRRIQEWLEAGARGASSEELAEMLDQFMPRRSRLNLRG